MKTIYDIMHGDRRADEIDTRGHCGIYDKKFMLCNLCLEVTKEDIDTLVNNIANVYYWCAFMKLICMTIEDLEGANCQTALPEKRTVAE